MNPLEKRSFYSFLFLYIGSSLFFLLLVGYWYFTAQKTALSSSNYYKMQHLSDQISSRIINAHMQGRALTLPPINTGYDLTLISTQGAIIQGSLPQGYTLKGNDYTQAKDTTILVSDTPNSHLNIKYVLLQNRHFTQELQDLKIHIITVMSLIALGIIFIAWILSKIFMRPIHDKVSQIEQFLSDISHELNTPITALQMSAQRALQKQTYDAKILTNITISTKQLYDIYQSLTFINFNNTQETPFSFDLMPLLQESISYYNELCNAKNITITAQLNPSEIHALPERMRLLFSNLIANAIKYSSPGSTITIVLRPCYFSIRDEGIGIAPEQQKAIFEAYQRGTTLGGGFGIGLTIVKQICSDFAINLALNSELKKGTQFELTWEISSD